MQNLPPLGLYIHVPWCVRKCPYCDFNSHVTDQIPEQAYLQALKQDFLQDLALIQGRSIDSIFFGGGTPSLMSGDFYQALLDFIAQHAALSPTAEVTLEANPGTAEAARFDHYRRAGINRLSLGVQSFDNAQLAKLGRIHSTEETLRAVAMARQAGFDNYNIDLMHGLPGQTPEDALSDIDQALACEPTHLSWYQLTIEPNTAFYSQPPTLPDEGHLSGIQDVGLARLHQVGFEQYEVSAYAKPQRQSRHNLNYWQFGDYLGIGAGAHGKVTLQQSGEVLRYQKTRLPKHYLQPKPHYRVNEATVPEDEMAFEFMMNALRLNEGVAEDLYKRRTGQSLEAIDPTLKDLRAKGLLMQSRLQVTPLGRRFLNSVLETFL